MDYNERLTRHRVSIYQLDDRGTLQRTDLDNVSYTEAMEHANKHKHRDVKVYNLCGHLIHEHKADAASAPAVYTASETYA